LVLTRRATDAQFWLAHDLLTRLPALHAAMDGGALDEPRARILSEWTTELDPEQTRALCAELLPRPPGLTTGQLIEQIEKLAIAVDPKWARRRYERAVADRKVVGYRNADGSANLSGLNLPVDPTTATATDPTRAETNPTVAGPTVIRPTVIRPTVIRPTVTARTAPPRPQPRRASLPPPPRAEAAWSCGCGCRPCLRQHAST
jgi:hypothetical protein